MKVRFWAIFMAVVAAIFFAVSLFATADITADITITSVLMGVGETSVSVFVGCSEPSYLAAMDIYDEGGKFWITGWVGFDLPEEFNFEIQGLTPGTTYYYLLGVGGNDGSYDSKNGFFTTISAGEKEPNIFLSLSSETPKPSSLPPGTHTVTGIYF